MYILNADSWGLRKVLKCTEVERVNYSTKEMDPNGSGSPSYSWIRGGLERKHPGDTFKWFYLVVCSET